MNGNNNYHAIITTNDLIRERFAHSLTMLNQNSSSKQTNNNKTRIDSVFTWNATMEVEEKEGSK